MPKLDPRMTYCELREDDNDELRLCLLNRVGHSYALTEEKETKKKARENGRKVKIWNRETRK